MKNIFTNSKTLALLLVLLISSCETVDLDLTKDPNKVATDKLELELAFNYVQVQLPDFANSANGFTQRVTRQMAMTGGNSYDNAFSPVSFNNNWSTGYDILNTIKFLEPKAEKLNDKYAIGAARVIRCYVLNVLVDMYGDIPYSEALLGSVNFFPKFDKSSDVYKGILSELQEAIVILQSSSGTPLVQDLYYDSKEDWIRLANTIRLKMLVNSRLAGGDIGITDVKAEIESILASNNYINSTENDFEFKYGTTQINPRSRHPQYNDMYELGGGAYICNYMFWTMTDEKNFDVNANGLGTTSNYDPRTGFYFYKQDSNPSGEDEFTLPGRSRPGHYDDDAYDSFYDPTIETCYTVSNWLSGPSIPTNGYWGRDHGNDSGIPPDNDKRTVTGLYPIGGATGDASSTQTEGTKGAKGQGIMPLILASYVKFLKAEAMLTLGVAGDPKQELVDAVTTSIDKTINFLPGYNRPGVSSSLVDSQKAFYINFIKDEYDDLAPANRLEMVIKEYFIASWGNGIEPYNSYRRTGFPSNFQPTLELVSGNFFSTALYPLTSQNNNPNMPNNVRTKRVFWHKSAVVLH